MSVHLSLLWALWLASIQQPNPVDSPFFARECRAIVTPPAPMVYQSRKMSSGLIMHFYVASSLERRFTVNCVIHPILAQASPRSGLDSARDGLIDDNDANLIEEHEISLDTSPGREIRFKRGDREVKARVFLIKDEALTLEVEATHDTLDSKQTDAFFASLVIFAGAR
jgi:hypothetical protein